MDFLDGLFDRKEVKWSSHDVDYETLLKMLRILEKETDSESTPLLRHDNASIEFFECCIRELIKVERFFTDKLSDSLVWFSRIETNLNRLPWSSTSDSDAVSAAVLAAEPYVDSEMVAVDRISSSGTVVDVDRLSQDVVDLRTNLELLQRYQTDNVETFRQVLQEHDRIRRSGDGTLWFLSHIRQSTLSNIDRTSELIATLQTIHGERLHKNGDRQTDEAALRIPPRTSPGRQWTEARIGFFCGLFLMSALVSALCAWFERYEHISNWHSALQLFRGLFLIVLFITFIGANVRGWKSSGIRYALLLDLDARNHLQPHNFFEIASGLSVIWSMMLLLYIVSSAVGISPFSAPLVVLACFFVFLVNPFRFMYFRARRWLLRVLMRIALAPFYRVEFADFWMADQLNSLSAVFVDLQYFICFYFRDVNWGTADSVVSSTCGGAFKGIAGCLPAWFRFAQCMRFYFDTRLGFPHLVNAGKYVTTLFVVLFSTLYNYSQQLSDESESGDDSEDVYEVSDRTNVMLGLWIGAMFVNSCYTSLWDVLMDWRLFVTDTTDGHVTNVFRRQLLFKHPCYYWVAVVQNTTLRFMWPLTVALRNDGLVITEIIRTTLALLEMYRRVIWNFFRLEVEQLNFDCDRDMRNVRLDVPTGTDSTASTTRITVDHRITSGNASSWRKASLSKGRWLKGFEGDETIINRNATCTGTSLAVDVHQFHKDTFNSNSNDVIDIDVVDDEADENDETLDCRTRDHR